MAPKFVTAREAIDTIKDGMTLATSGFVQVSNAEALLKELGDKFRNEGSPRDLTLFYCAGQGDGKDRSLNHLAQEGLIKKIIAGHYNMAPMLGEMITNNKVQAYNLPQGVLATMVRDMAAGKPGMLTHVGLGTFVDPRVEGGKLNDITTEDIIEVTEVFGKEQLLYKCHKLDVVFIKGSFADSKGNISMENEPVPTEVTSLAQAVHNNGGTVIVQVDKVVEHLTLDPKLVKVPGIYVDYVVQVEDPALKQQCYGIDYEPELCGNKAIYAKAAVKKLPLDAKKIIARRAAMEIGRGYIGNLGIGVPEYVSSIVSEEEITDWMSLTVEAGPVGGIPQGGNKFGASINADCILDQGYQFDFYDGGGLDVTFLGLAQADKLGNLNVSKFSGRIAGCGGFIDISQNAKKVVFCGTFTTGGLKCSAGNGKLKIDQEGKMVKFLEEVEQITFSGERARTEKQPTLYITERCVFEMREDGLTLIEIAPGIDLEKDVLAHMEFKPLIAEELKVMDERIFKDEVMGLKNN